MSSNTKKLIILTVILLALSGLFTLIFGSSGFIPGLFNKNGITGKGNSWTVNDRFTDIDIESITSDVRLYTTNERSAKVVWSGGRSLKLSVEVKNGKLTVTEQYKLPWFLRVNFNIGKSEISVYLPGKNYEDLEINSKTGRITVPAGFVFEDADIESDTGAIEFRASAGSKLDIQSAVGSIFLASVKGTKEIKIKSSVGGVELNDVTGTNISIEDNVGGITLTDVIASKELKVRNDVGSIHLERCDGGSIDIKTDTGSVNGSLLSGKTFEVKSDIGKVNVPETTGGPCKIETDTGSISIVIRK